MQHVHFGDSDRVTTIFSSGTQVTNLKHYLISRHFGNSDRVYPTTHLASEYMN